jgi:hypothetical protein
MRSPADPFRLLAGRGGPANPRRGASLAPVAGGRLAGGFSRVWCRDEYLSQEDGASCDLLRMNGVSARVRLWRAFGAAPFAGSRLRDRFGPQAGHRLQR